MSLISFMRNVTLSAVGNLDGGWLLSSIGSELWPDSGPAWEDYEPKVKAMIDSAVIQEELSDLKVDIDALGSLFKSFKNMSDPLNKGAALNNMLVLVERLWSALKLSKNAKFLLPVAVPAFCLSMAIVYERARYSSYYYAKPEPDWQATPGTKYQEYVDFFRAKFLEWQTWRSDQIEAVYDFSRFGFNSTQTGRVLDHVTQESFYHEDKGDMFNDDVEHYKKLCDTIKRRMLNDALCAMARELVPIYSTNCLIPGREQEVPVCFLPLDHVDAGPYCAITLSAQPRPKDKDSNRTIYNGAEYWVIKDGVIFDNQYDAGYAVVPRIGVRAESDLITGLRLHGSEGVGSQVGGEANQEVLTGNDRFLTGVRLSFDGEVLRNLRFYFSDGSVSRTFGGPDGPHVVERRFPEQSGYRLTYLYATRNASKEGQPLPGIRYILFGFDFKPGLPKWLDPKVPKVSLLSRVNGQRVTEQGGGLGVEGRPVLDDRSQFLLEPLPDDKIRLRNVHNLKYWQASGGGGGDVYSSSPNAGEWETFKCEWSGTDGSLSLKTSSNRYYVQANFERGGKITAIPAWAQAWEKFHLLLRNQAAFDWAQSKSWIGDMAISALVALQWIGTGRFVANRSGTLYVNGSDLDEQTLFEMRFAGPDTCYLYNPATSRYLIVEGDRVSATSQNRGGWEKLRFVRHGGFISLQAHTGKWLRVETVDSGPVLCATGSEPYSQTNSTFGFRVV